MCISELINNALSYPSPLSVCILCTSAGDKIGFAHNHAEPARFRSRTERNLKISFTFDSALTFSECRRMVADKFPLVPRMTEVDINKPHVTLQGV